MGWFSGNDEDKSRRLEENKRKMDYIEDKIKEAEYEYRDLEREINSVERNIDKAKREDDEGEQYFYERELSDLKFKQLAISYKIQDLNSDLRFLCR